MVRGIYYGKNNKEKNMKETDNFYKVMKKSPHVVLLGAGASCACIPNGDKNGLRISSMNDFFENTGINIGYTGSFKNLENIYKDIDDIKKELLKREVTKYFNKFKLPDGPTIYDVLVISLTKKDLIASFNWDPLLIQAVQRCHKITQDLPEIIFLHGNIWEWYAIDNDGTITKVFAESECSSPRVYIKTASGQRCIQTPLLFPEKKDYSKDSYIKGAWDILQNKLNEAFMLTIFGYSGPKSDEEALTLLKSGFLIRDKNNSISDINNFKQLTIIDTNIDNDKKNKLLESFERLLDVPQLSFTEGIRDYVQIFDGFWDENNWLITWPRLTTECYTITQHEGKFLKKYPITMSQNDLNWDNIQVIAKNQIGKEEL
jgi:hypothetical protein